VKATGEALGQIGLADAKDVSSRAVIDREVQRACAEMPGPNRGDIIRKVAKLVMEHGDEIDTQIVRETGSVRAKGHAEVALAAREMLEGRRSAEPALRHDHGQRSSRAAEHHSARSHRRRDGAACRRVDDSADRRVASVSRSR
jgi:acyl-CoA reductase-like NAD-dependent aldehyde dehydrogenase